MGDHSEEQQALMKIQHEWAEARVKGDSSYARRVEANDCTIVWPDGSIVNKQQDLQTMTSDIVFTEFKIDDLRIRLYGDTGIVVGQGTIRAHKGKQDLLRGKFVWTDNLRNRAVNGRWSLRKSLRSWKSDRSQLSIML